MPTRGAFKKSPRGAHASAPRSSLEPPSSKLSARALSRELLRRRYGRAHAVVRERIASSCLEDAGIVPLVEARIRQARICRVVAGLTGDHQRCHTGGAIDRRGCTRRGARGRRVDEAAVVVEHQLHRLGAVPPGAKGRACADPGVAAIRGVGVVGNGTPCCIDALIESLGVMLAGRVDARVEWSRRIRWSRRIGWSRSIGRGLRLARRTTTANQEGKHRKADSCFHAATLTQMRARFQSGKRRASPLETRTPTRCSAASAVAASISAREAGAPPLREARFALHPLA